MKNTKAFEISPPRNNHHKHLVNTIPDIFLCKYTDGRMDGWMNERWMGG